MEKNYKREMMREEEEFKRFYMEYCNIIQKVAYDYVRDFYLAQDICQEAFLRLHLYFNSMAKEKWKPWLIVVASNLAKDILKKGGQYKEIVELPESKVLESIHVYNNVDEFITSTDARAFYMKTLDKLREKNEMWYDVLVLVECMGVPRKKVARVYGIALTTVDGHLNRAKKWLRENYGEAYRNL